MSIKDRLQHGWNAFMGRDPTPSTSYAYAPVVRPDYVRLHRGNERTVITATLNRIAVDVASISLSHVNLDDQGRYKEPRKSKLQECLTIAANADQTARMFLQDAAMSLLDEGIIAIVPTEATDNPILSDSYDIGKLRVGRVVKWYPQYVTVNLFNEFTGEKEDRTFPKAMVAICENPFYAIMNEPNSTYQRLVAKLRALDVIDAQSSSGKLDLIIQVPYTTKTAIQKARAEDRRQDVERQLSGSKYGIAYIDGTEKIIQLNRAIENNLFSQVEYYTNMLHSQLGMPPAVFDGTADEATMLNYQNRTIEPIISAIVDPMKWKFLTKTARTQGQSIVFFQDPFKLTPTSQIAEMANSLTRNEILSANEVRQILGYKPSDDPAADQLKNSNMPQPTDQAAAGVPLDDN